MGSIILRNRGDKWDYRFEIASVDGQRKFKSKGGFRTKKEAQMAGTQAQVEYENAGMQITPTEMSYADYLEYWFTNYVLMNLKYHTQQAYRTIIDIHIKPVLGQYKVKSLNPMVLQTFVNNKYKNGGYKKSTLVNILGVLTGSLKYAVYPAQMIKESPALYLKHPRLDVARSEVNRTVISVSDFNKMLDRFINTPFYYSLLIGFYTGMRIGEVYGLTWEDIDFEAKTISVSRISYKRNYGFDPRNVKREKGKREEKSSWYFGDTKTKSSVRTIKIGDTLLSALKQYRRSQIAKELEYGEYYTIYYRKDEKDESGNVIHRLVPAQKLIPCSLPKVNLVMRKENGEYSSPDSFKYAARVIHHELNIQFNFHALRHTHATMLIENGISVKSVQERLGHADVETTLQTYVHDTEKMKDEAVNVFESAAKVDIR